MKKIGVGIMGIGWVAGAHATAMLKNPHYEIKALVSRRKETCEALKKEHDLDCDILDSYNDLLKHKDVDLIDITTPNVMHHEEVLKAAEAGKHMIIEKPICMNKKELQEELEAVRKAKVKTQTGFASRWNPHIVSVKNMIDKGGLGDIFFTEVDYYHEIGPWWSGYNWGANTLKGGPSASLAAGCHAVDLTRFFAGSEAVEVFAFGTFGHRKDYEYPVTYAAVIKFENGKIGKTGNSFENECPYVMNIILHGSKGAVFNEKFFSKEWFPGQEEWQEFKSTMLESGDVKHHPFKGMVDDLADAIINDKETENNIESSAKSHELCLAIDESIATGKKVQLPLIKW
jgi:predicted dehydrogenase